MTDTATMPAPKKSNKKLFVIIAIILGALGIDHYTFHYVSGGVDVAVTIADSTISASAHIDTTITISKKDTTNK